MSKCFQCEEVAVIQLINIDENGRMKEVFLCEKHAKDNGVLLSQGYNLIDGLPAKDMGVVLSRHVCPYCGCTKEWIEENKGVGCPQCYAFFTNISCVGFKNRCLHLGKIPKKFFSKKALQPRWNYWNIKLQALVKQECFEAAQACRKQLKVIEKGMKQCTN